LTVSRLLRLVVAVVLTAIVLYYAHPSEVLGAVRRADVTWIFAAIGLVLVDRTLMALRWVHLLSALTPGSRPSFPIVLRIFFVSSFVSNFVPSVAADMYRAYALARHEVRLAESTASVLMDRVLGVLSMAVVGAIALPFAPGAADTGGLAIGLALVFAGCGIVAAVIFSERAALLTQQAAALVPVRLLREMTVALTDAVHRYARHHGELLRVLVMSVLVQSTRILQAWCLGRSLGIELPLQTYFVLLPVILLVMQVPITVNGFGTTQVAFDRLFVPAGAAEAPTFALSLLFLALGVIGTLPGGLLYVISPDKPAARESRA